MQFDVIFWSFVVVASLGYLIVVIKRAVARLFAVADSKPLHSNEGLTDGDAHDGAETGYFTYESTPGNSCFANDPANVSDNMPGFNADCDAQVCSPDFDIRQAVVYNAILQNDFIESRKW